MLGLLLSAVVGLFIGLVWWQIGLADGPRKLNAGHWIVVASASAAVVGWMTNAIVTIRNSVKQHTINTLLQSRLSAAYMEKAAKVNASLAKPPGNTFAQISFEQVKNGDPIVSEVSYFLNYFEFIAVGIRHGDLDEDLMKGSIRGFVRKLCDVADEYIKASRTDAAGNPTRTLEHLGWLYARWGDGSTQARTEFGLTLAAYAGALVMIALLTAPAMEFLTAERQNAVPASHATPAPTAATVASDGASGPVVSRSAQKPAK